MGANSRNALESEARIAVQKLDAVDTDQEMAHVEADDILLRFVRAIAPEVADAYERVPTRTGDFWYA
jgi:hypothetical protein